MRVVEPMNAMMKGFSDDDLRSMANAVSSSASELPVAEPPRPPGSNGRAR